MDLKTTQSSGDSTIIAASTKWIAFCQTSTGSIGLLKHQEIGKRTATEILSIIAHPAEITDMKFSPFDDSVN